MDVGQGTSDWGKLETFTSLKFQNIRTTGIGRVRLLGGGIVQFCNVFQGSEGTATTILFVQTFILK